MVAEFAWKLEYSVCKRIKQVYNNLSKKTCQKKYIYINNSYVVANLIKLINNKN